jgi:hypothetical protein
MPTTVRLQEALVNCLLLTINRVEIVLFEDIVVL